MTNEQDRPLVTLFVFSYKQEDFIREAVAGAFAQTYSPLEIILSDDCSPDRTFAIMEEMAAAYRGPHQVRVNRNPTNLGIAAHVNWIASQARGELLIVNAGDDIAVPERTERLVAAWLASGRRAMSIFSNARIIDRAGKFQRIYCETSLPGIPWSLEEVLARRDCGLYGFSHAFSPELLRVFGPLGAEIVYEDRVLPFRSLLLGRIEYLPECLVNYRLHEANTSAQVRRLPLFQRVFGRRKFVARREAVCSAQWLRDLRQRPGVVSPAMLRGFERVAARGSAKDAVFGPAPVRGLLRALGAALRYGDARLAYEAIEGCGLRIAAWCEARVRR